VCRVLVAAQSKGRWEVFTLPKYRAQEKKKKKKKSLARKLWL